MYHLLLTGCIILITFGVLVQRYRVEVVYWLLVPLPSLFFLVGMVHEYFKGIQQFNHQVLHLAYDSSYVLLLVGILVILRAILKRRLTVLIVAGTCIAGIPIGYIFITQH